MTDILFWLQCSVSPALSVPDLADVTDTAHVVRTETVNTEMLLRHWIINFKLHMLLTTCNFTLQIRLKPHTEN